MLQYHSSSAIIRTYHTVRVQYAVFCVDTVVFCDTQYFLELEYHTVRTYGRYSTANTTLLRYYSTAVQNKIINYNKNEMMMMYVTCDDNIIKCVLFAISSRPMR